MSGAAAAVGKIERAHEMYREGRHEAALGLYTEALAIAKTKPQKIALHSNRAACFLKLHDFKKAAEECTAVLELDHKHTGALMLRAQTLVTLKEYQSALFDVSRLMELNPSSEVYQNLQDRLKTQLSLAPIPESGEEEALTDESEEEEQVPLEDRLDDDEEEDIENTTLETQTRKEDKKLETNAVHQKVQLPVIINEAPSAESLSSKNSSDLSSKGWEAIPKPKGHSKLDYSRWDEVADDSSEDDDDDDEEDSRPQYRFRVKTVGVQRVK